MESRIDEYKYDGKEQFSTPCGEVVFYYLIDVICGDELEFEDIVWDKRLYTEEQNEQIQKYVDDVLDRKLAWLLLERRDKEYENWY